MVTPSMMAEHLSGCSLAFMPSCTGQRFEFLAVLAPGVPADEAPAGPGVLACGAPPEALAYLGAHPDAWVLVIHGEGDSFEMPSPLPGRLLFCRSSQPASQVTARLQRLFQALGSWVADLRATLLRGGSYQDLLDHSEAVLGNFTTVSNSEFRLLAFTRSIAIDDPVSQEVVALGYHSPAVVERFQRHGTMRDWETQTRVEAKPAGLTRYPTFDYVFRSHGNYFLHVVMQCNNRPPSPGLRDAFQVLVDHIELAVRQEREERYHLSDEPSRLFGDLINHRPLGQSELRRRLGSAGLVAEGRFTLVALTFADDAAEGQLLPYHAHHARLALPGCAVGVHGTYLLVLDASGALGKEGLAQLQAFVNRHPCTGGLSEPFERMEDFALAFQQAKAAVDLATSPQPPLALQLEERPAVPLYRFGDRFGAWVASVAKVNNRLVAHTAEHGIVAAVAAFDRAHGTEDLRLLYVFLRNERNVRLTCEELFMHRSTLLYRVGRMQERLGFDLDDPAVRQRIMMEYLVRTASA